VQLYAHGRCVVNRALEGYDRATMAPIDAPDPGTTPRPEVISSPDRRADRRPTAGLTADDPRLGAWRAFLEAHARLARRLDDELRAGHGISLAEYDALLQLARAPGRRLRMNQLADRVILSRSGITRLVDRLVAAGLVERTACSTDARGAEAVLTEAGLERLRQAARTHLAGIDRYFVSVVDPSDLPTVERALAAVARRACRGAVPTPPPAPDADEPVPDADEAAPDPAAALDRAGAGCRTSRGAGPSC
jgi:DNA-binding MarR family transcriptional regulator